MLEEKILTVVIKHMGLSDTVNNIGMWQQETCPEFFILSELVTEVYLKINSLIRRLQVLANLESQWKEEVSKMKVGDDVEVKDVFFQDYLHHESKTKELALLCFLKGVKIDEKSQEQKIMQQLKDIIEKEARLADHRTDGGTTTESIVKGIFARLDLLLRVDINSNCESEEAAMTRSLQCWPEVSGEFKSFRRQLSDVERTLDDSILQIPKLQSRLNIVKGRKFALDALRRELHNNDQSNRLNLLEQIFCFIGYRPEEAVSTKSFLKAVSVRRQRCEQRIETLKLMRHILHSAGSLSWAFVTPIAEILNRGLRTEELSCGNMVLETAQEFSQTILQLVKTSSKHRKSCIASIGNLCVIPYKRSDEKCLLHSQLVRLLDELCDAQDLKSFANRSEDQNSLSQLAWLGFKVLAQRCIAWEEELEDGEEDQNLSFGTQKCDPLSLEKQISNLLANYLVKATQSGNVAIGNEILQEVLVLLSALSKNRLGRGILSEPPCVSKLLQLLMEPYLSPKVTMTIVKLANVALPIMTREACNQLLIHCPSSPQENNVESNIINLLLTKLSDYLIPESESLNKTVSENISPPDEIEEFSVAVESQGPSLKPETSNKLSLFVHKRKDQVTFLS
jgi:E3 ubiquitin-protein ligase HECTD4